MADAAINTTINFVLGTAVSLAADRIRMILGVKKELERISATAETIQGFLADADGKCIAQGSKIGSSSLRERFLKQNMCWMRSIMKISVRR